MMEASVLYYAKLKSYLRSQNIKKELYPFIFKAIIFLAAWKKLDGQRQTNSPITEIRKLNSTDAKTFLATAGKNVQSGGDIFSLFLKDLHFPEYDSYREIIHDFIVNLDTLQLDLQFCTKMLDMFNIQTETQTNFKSDITNLMLQLSCVNKPAQSVYYPLASCISSTNNTTKYSYTIDQPDKDLFFINKVFSIICSTGNIYLSKNNPLMTDDSSMDNSFDMALSFIPANINAVIPTSSQFLFERYSKGQQIRYGETVYWQKLLSVSTNVITCSYQGPFFRGGKEEQFRKNLVKRGWIERIILLPEYFEKYNSNTFQVLVIDTTQSRDHVLFIDARSAKNIAEILEISKNFKNHPDTCLSVSKNTVKKHQYNLLVSRYVTKKQLSTIAPMISLKDACTIIRPQKVKSGAQIYDSDDEMRVYDMKSIYYSRYGFTSSENIIEAAGGQEKIDSMEGSIPVNIDEKGTLISRYRVKPLDIIMTTTGSAGSSAILSPNFKLFNKKSNKEIPVVASQTTHILRVKSEKEDDAVALFIYLNSIEGKTKLDNITNKGKINTIKSNDLRRLTVPPFDDYLNTYSRYTFDKIIEINKQKETLDREIEEYRNINLINIKIFLSIYAKIKKNFLSIEPEISINNNRYLPGIQKKEKANGRLYYDNFITFYKNNWEYNQRMLCLRLGVEPLSEKKPSSKFFWGITMYNKSLRVSCNENELKTPALYFRNKISGTDTESDMTDERYICSKYFDASINLNLKAKAYSKPFQDAPNLLTELINRMITEFLSVSSEIDEFLKHQK